MGKNEGALDTPLNIAGARTDAFARLDELVWVFQDDEYCCCLLVQWTKSNGGNQQETRNLRLTAKFVEIPTLHQAQFGERSLQFANFQCVIRQ